MTWRMVQAIIDANVLPDGVLSLVCGSAHNLLEYVDWSDVVAFMGGADTAIVCVIIHKFSQRDGCGVEADSLSTVLAQVDDVTYDAFIFCTARDDPKAGQKLLQLDAYLFG